MHLVSGNAYKKRVSVHSVHSNLVKMLSKSPLIINSGIENKPIPDFRCQMIIRRENLPDLIQKDRSADRIGLFAV